MIANMSGGQQCAVLITAILIVGLVLDSYFKSKYGRKDDK
jgi:hypothetical protein